MEYCLAAAALNGVDRRSLQRSARLGREVLERAKRRAVDWHSPERSRGNVGILYRQGPSQERWSVPGPQRLLGEVRTRAGGDFPGVLDLPLGRREPPVAKRCKVSGQSGKILWEMLLTLFIVLHGSQVAQASLELLPTPRQVLVLKGLCTSTV